MKNRIDKNMTEQQIRAASEILEELGLSGLAVIYETSQKSFRFIQDRRTVCVPEVLVVEKRWTDIRHIFRAVLDSPPAVLNHGAPNEWG